MNLLFCSNSQSSEVNWVGDNMTDVKPHQERHPAGVARIEVTRGWTSERYPAGGPRCMPSPSPVVRSECTCTGPLPACTPRTGGRKSSLHSHLSLKSVYLKLGSVYGFSLMLCLFCSFAYPFAYLLLTCLTCSAALLFGFNMGKGLREKV